MNLPGLTFEWNRRHWFCPRLAVAFAFSLLAHLLLSLVFTVESPEKVSSPTVAPELSILSWDIPEHKALLESLQSDSPLGALAHRLLPLGNLAEATYHPSFAQSRLAPLESPHWTPRKLVPLPLVPPPHPPAPIQTSTRFPGALKLESPLDIRLPHPPKIPSAPSHQLLEPVTFLIGVRNQGEIAFISLQKSSGDSTSDQEAEAFLRQTRFLKNETPLQWGHATLLWATPDEP